MLAALLALLAICALPTSRASAVIGEFGAQGEGAGEFAEATGIGVNEKSGDVYLADTRNNRLEQFSAEGHFIRVWGWGVSDGSSEAFQRCEAPGPCFGAISDSAAGQLALPKGIAIDNSAGLSQGDVYVEDVANNRIERYSEDGEFILAFGGEVNKATGKDVCLAGEECQAGTPGSGPSQFEVLGRNAIAVGPTGTVYVGDNERVQKFSASGKPEGEVPLTVAGAVELLAVDSSGDLYVLSSALQGVRKYDGTGAELGEARDPEAGGLLVSITLSPSDELLVSDPVRGHVISYDPSGTELSSFPVEGSAAGGIALRTSGEALYVINEPAPIRILALPPEGPLILEGSQSASEVLPTTTKLNATINPEGPEETKYHFQYGTSEAYGSETPEEALTPGFEDRPASAPLTGLLPNTTYHFRAVATNVLSQTSLGPDQIFTTLPAVSIESESSSGVTTTSARLSAELNPHGLPSDYHFEYGLSTAYGKSAPIPGASAGEGSEGATFSITIQELKPQSTYHYRVVAHNSLGTVQGPDQTFKTQGGEVPALPDGRAFEMVSPPDKHGVSLEGIIEGGLTEAAADGHALTYIALGAIDADPAGNRSSNNSQLLATRQGPGLWSTLNIATAHQAPAGVVTGKPSEYKLFSADLSLGIVEPFGATPLSPQASERTPYRREASGSFSPLVNPSNVPEGTEFGGKEIKPELFEGGVEFTTGTPDLSQVLLRSPSSLVLGFENAGQQSIYEWNEGTLAPVSVLPSGAPAAEEGEADVGNRNTQMRGAISADGKRAFFSTFVSGHIGRLYMRDMQRGETLRLDGAESGLKEAEGGATFQLATGDGSKAFFTDANRLTKDATARPGAPDVYQCTIKIVEDELRCELEDLSVSEHFGKSADVQGAMLGADQSGRYVYFVARGALAPGAVEGSCPEASEESCLNLYALDTQTSARRLVAVLAEGDQADWNAVGGGNLGEMTTRVSPNGRFLAFMSQRPLTSYDNRDANSGARDEEVYLYDYASNELTCASCDPSGQRPAGVFEENVAPGPLVDRPLLWAEHWVAGSIPGWTRIDLGHALHQSRYLSNSGRLFFNTPIGLVESDTNRTQDVYEYEPAGVGSCTSATGCVGLISAGTSSEETGFLDASESGDDVFFITAAQLSLADEDKAFDVYDSHVCTVAPGCPPPALGNPPPCISADACRAAPTPQSGIFGAPASSTFSGTGNLTPPTEGRATQQPRPLTRAQRLAHALAACKKLPKGGRRSRCMKKARARYGRRRTGKKSSKLAGKKKGTKNARRGQR